MPRASRLAGLLTLWRSWIVSTDVKSLAFAAFLAGGYFKADERLAGLPFDLTLFLAVLSIVFAGYTVIRSGFRLPVEVTWIVGLFILMALPLFWTSWSPYAIDKSARLFTLTFVAALLPTVLCRTVRDLRLFLNSVCFVGLLMALDGAITWLTTPKLLVLTAWGANTIALGRATGAAAVWLAIRSLHERLHGLLRLGLAASLFLIMYASGSRGPLLSAFISLALVGVFFYMRRASAMLRFAAVVVAVTVFTLHAASLAPIGAAHRIGMLMEGDWGRSGQIRAEALVESLDTIVVNPVGLGWGGFADHIYVRAPGGALRYPHNFAVETFLEGGWLVGLAFLGVLALSVRRAYRAGARSGLPEGRALFALLVFAIGNALVSGDLNDNRLLFALMTTALVVRLPLAGSQGATGGGVGLRRAS